MDTAYLREVQIYHPYKAVGLALEFTELSESRNREFNLAFEQAKCGTSCRRSNAAGVAPMRRLAEVPHGHKQRCGNEDQKQ